MDDILKKELDDDCIQFVVNYVIGRVLKRELAVENKKKRKLESIDDPGPDVKRLRLDTISNGKRFKIYNTLTEYNNTN